MRRSGPPQRRVPLQRDSVPLQRYTELAPGGLLQRREPLRQRRSAAPDPDGALPPRGGPSPRPPVRTTTPARSGPDPDTVGLLEARDGGRCVACGRPGTAWDRLVPHHRVNRGMGGSRAPWISEPPNLAMVHESENLAFEDAVGAARDDLERRGLKLRHGQDPAVEPVLYPDGRWYLLDVAGGRDWLPEYRPFGHPG